MRYSIALLLLPAALCAEVAISPLFSDHAVLQRERPVRIFGTADAAVTVTVRYAGASVSTTANNGAWEVELPAMKAHADGTDLVVEGGNTITVRDVVVGDVWIGNGQSNMEIPVHAMAEADQAVLAAGLPMIRLMTVPNARVTSRRDFATGMVAWKLADSTSVNHFSATGWYSARALQPALTVPVGMITAAMGATEIEFWLPRAGTAAVAPRLEARIAANLATRNAERAAYVTWWTAKQAGKDAGPEPYFPPEPFELYGSMVQPLSRLAVTGIIWYQGESDFGDGWAYRSYLSTLIRGWRHEFHRDQAGDELPVIVVQLPGWDREHEQRNNGKGRSAEELAADTGVYDWIPELRDAQGWVATTLPRVATVTTLDLGMANDRHPVRKREVGERVALTARALVYGQQVALAPRFARFEAKDGKAIVHFTDAAGGLRVSSGTQVLGFTISGGEKDPNTNSPRWFRVSGTIVGNTVVLQHPEVATPVAVRYGWQDFSDANLLGSTSDMPVAPFRSDAFELRSFGKWSEP